MSTKIRMAPNRRVGDHIRAKDHAIVITLRGTSEPVVVVKPGYNAGIGPHLTFCRVRRIGGEEDTCFTLGAGGVMSLIRWLPMTLNAARRMGRSQPKP